MVYYLLNISLLLVKQLNMLFFLNIMGFSFSWIMILNNIPTADMGYCTDMQPIADWCKLGIFTQTHQILASLRMNFPSKNVDV